jgi:P-aminobenzoate N-oxygenase AurF
MHDALKPATRRRVPLDRLSVPAQAREDRIDWSTPIDRSRRFYCDRLTPLYHTPVYAELSDGHRLRYNQLTGLYSNELIGFLETFVLRRTLDALTARRDLAVPAPLMEVLHQFKADEARHAGLWKRLNGLSEPEWYRDRDYRILAIPRLALAAVSFVASHPVGFPMVFWMQLAQEERSIDISRRLAAAPAGEIEPRYAAVYGDHLRDEVRHVQIDWHLIDHLYARRTALARGLNARIFRYILGAVFLTPSGATARIIHRLVAEFPELQPLEPRMLAELGALGGSEAYHAMMYSRETTPVTFALFDRFAEFHRMRECLKTYHPGPMGGES